MADNWRLRAQFDDEAGARQLTKRLRDRDLEHDLDTSFHNRIVVSRDGSMVFCYANTRAQAEAAQRLIERLTVGHTWSVDIDLQRWHPVAERWELPDAALPRTPAEREREHTELIASEREESRDQGFPIFEVRIRCESHRDAAALAERLAGDGIPTVHRWQFVVAGANDEDSANSLAASIRAEAPRGTSVSVEGSVQEVTRDAPYATQFSPFAVLGGLGG